MQLAITGKKFRTESKLIENDICSQITMELNIFDSLYLVNKYDKQMYVISAGIKKQK